MGGSLQQDRLASSPPHRSTRRQNAGSEPAADFATSINVYAEDGIHLTDYGYQALASVVAEAANKLLR